MTKHDLHPRAAKYKAHRYRDLLCHLWMASSSLAHLSLESAGVDRLLQEHHAEWSRLTAKAGERMEPRRENKRPANGPAPQADYYLFLDECGSHVPQAKDSSFPVFALCGVVVPVAQYEAFDRRWKQWKRDELGREDVLVHEPDVRNGRSTFRGSSPERRVAIQASLSAVLEELHCHCITAVVDLRTFVQQHPDSVVDDFLPASCYLMSIDFVLERFLHYLETVGNYGRGLVVAESRGAKEDALVHAEFIRLHLEGTQFVSERRFRGQLRPYIEFFNKRKNNSGLQIADLAARPMAEKVLNPQATPDRWNVFEPKIYEGNQAAPHKFGLKVFPLHEGNDPYPHLPSKAKGSVYTLPSTD